jgi:hypothetical protein
VWSTGQSRNFFQRSATLPVILKTGFFLLQKLNIKNFRRKRTGTTNTEGDISGQSHKCMPAAKIVQIFISKEVFFDFDWKFFY